MTTTLPRPIEPGEAKIGARIRATYSSRETRFGGCATVEGIVAARESDVIWLGASTDDERYSIDESVHSLILLAEAPTLAPAVGSRWRDPETGVKYVRTDRDTFINYEWPVPAVHARPVLNDDADTLAIARLTPIPDHGDGCSPWQWDKETDTGWVEAALDDSDRSHVQVSGRYLNGAYLLKNSNPDCAIAARLRPWSERGQANG